MEEKEKTYLVIFPDCDPLIEELTKEQIEREIKDLGGYQDSFMIIDGKMLKKSDEKIDIEKL